MYDYSTGRWNLNVRDEMRASVLKRLMEIEDERLRGVLIDVVAEMEKEWTTREMLESFVQRTDENFKRVWEAIHELAEAQKRTEERVEELAEAQKRTEKRLEKLAEAQERTEERLNRLEETVAQLAEAQRRTEEELRQLAGQVRSLTDELRELKNAFWGEKGRLEGERYEWQMIQSARRLLGRGRGGSRGCMKSSACWTRSFMCWRHPIGKMIPITRI